MRWGAWMAVVGTAILAFGGGDRAEAQMSWPRITSVVPSGAQRGTTVEVTISGINVGLATGLIFEGSGITVEAVTPEPQTPPAAETKPAAGTKPAEVPKNRTGKVTARLRVAPDAAPGIREMRVLTPLGPSDIGSFVVGLWPEVAEQEPNNTPAQAQAVTLPVTVFGQANPAEDVDCFRFQARAGQTLVFDVLAERMGSSLDSILSIQDASGRELALNEDANGDDSLLAFEAPKAGEYFVIVRDLRYQGSANHFYRLTMGEIPYVAHVFPPGGGPGEKLQLELSGYNLGKASRGSVAMPAEILSDSLPMAVTLPTGASNPVRLAVGDAGELTEVEPNDVPARAQTIPVPGTVAGRILVPGSVATVASTPGSSAAAATDTDCFRFRATKGQRLILEVLARRFGSDLDSMLVVTDAKQKEVATNDDGAAVAGQVTKDSRLDFTAPDTGEFVAQITDLQGRQGPGYAYLFSIRVPEGDFKLTFTPDRLAVGPGGRIPVTVTAERLFGFDGEIAIEFAGLPAGVSVVGPSRIRSGDKDEVLVLTAAPGSAIQTTDFRVTGVATIAGKTVRRTAQGLEEVVENNQKSTHPVNLWTAAVTEAPELIVTVPPDKLTLPKGGSVEITVKVERKEGYKGKIPLTVIGLPNGVTATATDLADGKSEGKITLKTDNKASIGESDIVVAANVVIDNQRRVLHAAPAVTLAVTPPAPAAPAPAVKK
jgi:Bacterial pre-peptidase C-terminal domain